jgi:glycerophosphoryl diester phosphodiesterase
MSFLQLTFEPPVIAHRGASAYAPENTLSAFVKAAQLGAKWVEFDVTLAACGEPIVFHDDTLERTTDGAGEVTAYPYFFLQTLDAGGWFSSAFSHERIPTLSQILAFLKAMKMGANIELKAWPGHEVEVVKKVLEVTQSYFNLTDPAILFSSFSFDMLTVLRNQAPDCHIGLLLHEWEPNWQTVCENLQCVAVHVNEEIMTEKAAAEIKGMNKYLLCYTVNRLPRAKTLYELGVDALFTDVPDQLHK